VCQTGLSWATVGGPVTGSPSFSSLPFPSVLADRSSRVGGYGDDGRGVRLLLGGAAALRVVVGDPLDPPGTSSSSGVPCRLLLEAQGVGTAVRSVPRSSRVASARGCLSSSLFAQVESFVPSKEVRCLCFLLRRGQFGRGAVANG
jgi:hypothetical protein